MRNYNEYMQTATVELSLHDLAKTGDLLKFSEVIERDRSQLNQKDHKGYSHLMYAAYHGHLGLVNFIIDQGADVNSTDFGGNSILMGVAFKGHNEIAGILLKHGAQKDHKNQQGQTALDFAQMFGRWEIASLLRGQEISKQSHFIQSIKTWLSYLTAQLKRRHS